ncbi:hypothetical protein EV586_103471 [Tumebacillus sp. BK434]|uniref:hypothetical protein n=1 Tax=Tumebacillus sp. BK434 TaxID=2512169 RepID=UPI0010492CDA|nr:hypothetical protein [Tumebacillus sp. BK434]TCP55815.1 hypothetical protein EV586_103471 [Tumebacillus sp. BK434]
MLIHITNRDIFLGAILASVLFVGCGVKEPEVLPSVPAKEPSQAKGSDEQKVNEVVKQYGSAALLALDTSRPVATEVEMEGLAMDAKMYFQNHDLDNQLSAPIREGSLITMFYQVGTSTPTVVAAGIGLGVNDTPAHVLVWQSDGQWKAQPYPKASAEDTAQREETFKRSPYRFAKFKSLHQKGSLLAVVLEYGNSKAGQEVQLLRLENGVWRLVWLPTYVKWETLYNAQIEMQSIDSFIVHREDNQDPNHRWDEVWELRDDHYVQIQ